MSPSGSPEKLYKYRRGSDLDLDALSADYVYAAPPTTLNDPFELRVRLKDVELAIVDVFASSVASKLGASPIRTLLVNFIERLRNGGICSFCSTHLESRCWVHYAGGYEGFCLEFDVRRLFTQALRAEALLRVEYLDSPPVLGVESLLGLNQPLGPNRLAQTIVATKHTGWQYEAEWRVVTGTPGKKAYDFRALTAVYLGYNMSAPARQALLALLAGREVFVYEVAPSLHSYELTATRLDVPLNFFPRYRYSIAPIATDRPPLDEHIASDPKLCALHRKAIEVVRRDPYCSLVYDAFLSPESTGARSIITVTYQGPERWPSNMRLTAEQIEQEYSRLDDVESPNPSWQRTPPG